MSYYVRKALDRLKHTKPKIPQYAPHRWSFPAYGKRLQMAPDTYNSDIFDKKATKRIQSIVGNMLYYARSVDPTMIWAINKILRVQSRSTQDTEEKARMLLEYVATYPNGIICYKASNMFLHVDSEASYLTIPKELSCYKGHFYLSDWTSPSPIKPNPYRNGSIHT